jgi:hypothetical protein
MQVKKEDIYLSFRFQQYYYAAISAESCFLVGEEEVKEGEGADVFHHHPNIERPSASLWLGCGYSRLKGRLDMCNLREVTDGQP